MMKRVGCKSGPFRVIWNEFGCVTLVPYVTLTQHLGKFEMRMMAIVWASPKLKVIRRRFRNPSMGVQQMSVAQKLG